MLESGDLKKGVKIEIDGEPYILVQFEFVKPGKGQALYKCKLKNMVTGAQFDRTFRSGEKQLGEAKDFLKENTVCNILLFEGRPIGISLPIFINLKVEETEPWAKGDTASGDSKPATLETGYVLQVPPFIEKGELLKIDTRTGAYVERVKE
jgi:elongation factor P